jgi:hypothetical protein
VLGVGIVVTVVAGILIARGAKRELADMRASRAAAASAERAEGAAGSEPIG